MSGSPTPQPLLALPGPVNCFRYDGDFQIIGQPIVVHQEGGQVRRRCRRCWVYCCLLPPARVSLLLFVTTHQGRGTAWAVWDGAAAAAKYLEAAAEEIKQQHSFTSVLELGAGTGLAGLAAASALQLPTLLTDLPEVLPALRYNIITNPSLAQLVTAVALDWTAPQASAALADPSSSSGGDRSRSSRLVLAADCVWLEKLVRPFVSALELAASAPADRALLAYQSRSSRVDDLLFSLLRRRFDVEAVAPLPGEPPRGPIDLYWLSPKNTAAAAADGDAPL